MRTSMNHLIQAVRMAASIQNHYAALSLALALPDICGKLENPTWRSTRRYTEWFRANMQPRYTHPIGPSHGVHVFLSAEDCYALRCAYLHEGDMDITEQHVRQTLERFHFVLPSVSGNVYHFVQHDNAMAIEPGRFCEEICQAVEVWLSRAINDPVIGPRIHALPKLLQVIDRQRSGLRT